MHNAYAICGEFEYIPCMEKFILIIITYGCDLKNIHQEKQDIYSFAYSKVTVIMYLIFTAHLHQR